MTDFANDLPSTDTNPLIEKPIGISATEKELQFIKKYKELQGKATAAARLVFDCKDNNSAAVIGSRLVKKFGLKKPNEVVMPENKFDASGYEIEKMKKLGIEASPVIEEESIISHGGQHGRFEVLSDAMKSGLLSFRELFNEMRTIAFCYKDKSVSIRALTTLKEWWDEAKRQHDNLEMAERDVISVMSDALASVDKQTYITILKNVRAKRGAIMKERTRKIDVEAIVRDEQEKRLWSEDNPGSYEEIAKEETSE